MRKIFIILFLLLSLSQQSNNLFAVTLGDLVSYDEESTSFWGDPDLNKYSEAIKGSNKTEIKNTLMLLAENYYTEQIVEQTDDINIEEMYEQTGPKISKKGLETISKISSGYKTETINVIDVIKHIINNCSSKFTDEEYYGT